MYKSTYKLNKEKQLVSDIKEIGWSVLLFSTLLVIMYLYLIALN